MTDRPTRYSRDHALATAAPVVSVSQRELVIKSLMRRPSKPSSTAKR